MKRMLTMMMMVLALGMALMAEETKVPAELATVQNEYRAQLEAATAPIKAKYVAKLETLKKQLGSQGKLDIAMAVQKELDSLKEKEPEEASAELQDYSGAWAYGDPRGGQWKSTVVLRKQGTRWVGVTNTKLQISMEVHKDHIRITDKSGQENVQLTPSQDKPYSWEGVNRDGGPRFLEKR